MHGQPAVQCYQGAPAALCSWARSAHEPGGCWHQFTTCGSIRVRARLTTREKIGGAEQASSKVVAFGGTQLCHQRSVRPFLIHPADPQHVYTPVAALPADMFTFRSSSEAREASSTHWVEICVEDTGCGVPGDHAQRLLEPFFQSPPTGTSRAPRFSGSGLGLGACVSWLTSTCSS